VVLTGSEAVHHRVCRGPSSRPRAPCPRPPTTLNPEPSTLNASGFRTQWGPLTRGLGFWVLGFGSWVGFGFGLPLFQILSALHPRLLKILCQILGGFQAKRVAHRNPPNPAKPDFPKPLSGLRAYSARLDIAPAGFCGFGCCCSEPRTSRPLNNQHPHTKDDQNGPC
jgi:hypothetical protein